MGFIDRRIQSELMMGGALGDGGRGFNSDNFMRSLQDGVAFDFTDLDTLFQDEYGKGVVTANPNPVGLALSKKPWGSKTRGQVIAAAPELAVGVSTAPFNAVKSIVAGRERFTANGGTNPYAQLIATGLTIGRTYYFSVLGYFGTVINTSQIWLAASASATLGDVTYGEQNIADGVERSFYFTATSTTAYLKVRHANTTIGTYFEIGAWKLREVTTHTAKQAGATSKPLIQVGGGVKYDGSNDEHTVDYNGYFAAGPELFPDPNFVSGSIGNWTAINGVATVVANRLRVRNTLGPFQASVGRLLISGLKIGTAYRVGGEIVGAGGAGAAASMALEVRNTADNASLVNLSVAGATFGRRDGIFVATETSHYIRPRFDGNASADNTTYVEWDNFTLTELTSRDNFLIIQTQIPLSIATAAIISGISDPYSKRFRLGVATNGQLVAGMGDDASILLSAADFRGQTVTIGMSFNGTILRLFLNNNLVVQQAQNGQQPVGLPFKIGAQNTAGVATAPYGGIVYKWVAGSKFLTQEQYRNIASQL